MCIIRISEVPMDYLVPDAIDNANHISPHIMLHRVFMFRGHDDRDWPIPRPNRLRGGRRANRAGSHLGVQLSHPFYLSQIDQASCSRAKLVLAFRATYSSWSHFAFNSFPSRDRRWRDGGERLRVPSTPFKTERQPSPLLCLGRPLSAPPW